MSILLRRFVLIIAACIALSACTMEQALFYAATTEDTRSALTAQQLRDLRHCESTDNYQAVNPTGTFRGAYQFNQTTWDDVASRHYHWLMGRDPITVTPAWQDAMARALYSERGAQPWPVCGRHI